MSGSVAWAWVFEVMAEADEEARKAAEVRQGILTKPPGALGRLEEVAVRLAALQGRVNPALDDVQIAVFAADHGVAAAGVSAFPQAVTAEMVKNFARGGAAINVLARLHGARLTVVNLGTVVDTGPLEGVVDARIAPGTANFLQQPAMTAEQLGVALNTGRDTVIGGDLFIGGEMGIGNTTSAAALACALLQRQAKELVGPGTGLDEAGVAHKAQIIAHALERHARGLDSPLEMLRCLGGFEIAALVGAYLACGQRGIPVLVDGFISSVAALVAVRLRPGLLPWLCFSHGSAEPGHRLVLQAMNAAPLLDLGMRLGEASGAAVALPLLRQACALHNEMATFAEAGVSEA